MQLEASQKADELEELGNQKSQYRSKVRKNLWPRYLNRELKSEHLLGSMPYTSPKISKIDPAGLVVQHSGGSARVGVSKLSKKFRELLDLNVQEAEKMMTEIFIRDARARSERSKRETQAGQPTRAQIDDMVAKKLQAEVSNVEKYLDLIRRAEDAARIARHNDRYSSNRSVPGKLESWADRAEKFEKAERTYRNKLAKAIGEVRLIDPYYIVPAR